MDEQIKCKSCGAPLYPSLLDNYTCPYCGAVYKNDGVVHFVEINPPFAENLVARVAIPFDSYRYIPEDVLSEECLRKLTHKLAEGLAAFMKIDIYKDPMEMQTVFTGRVRVVKPDYRF